ncbi:YihY/virulence factor BrkB family protein [Actinomyces minihominis]|uniref:YihY/virulence factor BrkB family protein n=1 Tax=Actinomyces minihominis TaxID=2002838 RepID=UPI000C084DB5|nr:YihY/virulence factor BrkB family protein [Actinomyces minihominis]
MQQKRPAATAEQTYSLIHADQWKSRFRDLGPALRTSGFKNKIKAVAGVYQHHRIGRGLTRYSMQKGRLAAGAISYMAVFSLSAALTVAWTLFSHFFTANPEFQSLVLTTVNQFVPGLVTNPTTGVKGIIDPGAISQTKTTIIAGIAAFVAAVWSSIQVIRYISDGIRSMFGLLNYPGTNLKAFARYLLGIVLLFLGVMSTVLLTLASGWFEEAIASIFPTSAHILDTRTFDFLRTAFPSLIDFIMFGLIVRYVARIRVPRATLLTGSLAFAILSTILRFSGEALIRASDNPVIATIATAAALLLWVNFLARAALMVSAWMADAPAVVIRVKKEYVHGGSFPNFVTLHAPETLKWPHNPVTGDIIPAIPISALPAELSDELKEELVVQIDEAQRPTPRRKDTGPTDDSNQSMNSTVTGA